MSGGDGTTLISHDVAVLIGRKEGAAAATALALSALLPQNSNLPKLCLFNRATGYPCPFCGLSRSFADISHGDLRASILHHPLGIPLYLATGIISLGAIIKGRIRLPVRRVWLWLFIASLAIAWVSKLCFVPRKYW